MNHPGISPDLNQRVLDQHLAIGCHCQAQLHSGRPIADAEPQFEKNRLFGRVRDQKRCGEKVVMSIIGT